jgi:4-hydroxybenzoate polyprenyltransferase
MSRAKLPSTKSPFVRPATGLRRNLQAYAELVRLPNVFTAVADIALGWLCAMAAGASFSDWPIFILLALASGCLYSSGMAWNDYFDVVQDQNERPFRPIPSGRISRKSAAIFAAALQVLGLIFAAATALFAEQPRWSAPLVALVLVAAILLYDGWLKRTWAGPIAMGSCRFLNVLLGLSIADSETIPWGSRHYLASIVGIYIVGVTWFARTEAKISSRTALRSAAAVMLAALLLTLAVPKVVVPSNPSVLFPYLLVALGLFIGFPIAGAINVPAPADVQRAIKRCLIGLVILDAILASAAAGTVGLLILLLLLPVMYLGRWIYST